MKTPRLLWLALIAVLLGGADYVAGPIAGLLGLDSPIFYVATTGSDTNSCTAAASPCLTIQAGFNKAIAKSHAAATLQIADGTYTAGLACNYSPQILANGGIVVTGNAANAANVVINTTANNTNSIQAQDGCIMTVQHLTLTANGAAAGNDMYVLTSAVVYASDIIFGASKSMHMDVTELGQVIFTGTSAITGGGVAHYHVHGGIVVDQAHSVAISNSPTFTSFFAGVAGSPGWLAVIGTTYTNAGTVTAPTSLLVHNGGFVDTQAACASFFPGTAAVVASTGIDPATFGTCGGSGPLTWVFNSGLNAQEIAPAATQNLYFHGTGGGGMRLGAGIWLGQMFDSTGTPTIASGACGTGTNGTLGGTPDNMAGIINIGAAVTASCVLSFSGTLPNTPHSVHLTPANAVAAALAAGSPFVSALSTASFTFQAAALANTSWYYQVR